MLLGRVGYLTESLILVATVQVGRLTRRLVVPVAVVAVPVTVAVQAVQVVMADFMGAAVVAVAARSLIG